MKFRLKISTLKKSTTDQPFACPLLQEAGRVIDSGMDVRVYGKYSKWSWSFFLQHRFELLIGVIVEKLCDLHLDRLDSVKIVEQTENHFIGVNSGIDHLAIGGVELTNEATISDTNTSRV